MRRRTRSSRKCSNDGKREQLFARAQEAAKDSPSLRVLRRSADCERPAGNSPRLLANDQGSVLPAPRDARIPRRAKSRLGYSRTAGRDRSREAARYFSGKQQIEEIGVEKFNQLCRESVWKYRGDWEKLSERIGFWLDYSDPYVTYHNNYVESVWWALKTLYDKDLLYRGHKILPYCARCGTALSSHEVAQGYKDVKDPSVYVALHLGGRGSRGNVQPQNSRLDDDAVDARVECRARGSSGARIRRAVEEELRRAIRDDHPCCVARACRAWRRLCRSVGHRRAADGQRARRNAISPAPRLGAVRQGES